MLYKLKFTNQLIILYYNYIKIINSNNYELITKLNLEVTKIKELSHNQIVLINNDEISTSNWIYYLNSKNMKIKKILLDDEPLDNNTFYLLEDNESFIKSDDNNINFSFNESSWILEYLKDKNKFLIFKEEDGLTEYIKINCDEIILVNLKTLTNQYNFRVKCKIDDTVKNIKKEIEKISGINAEYQSFIFAGNPLKDSTTLRECCIYYDCTLHLIFKKANSLKLDNKIIIYIKLEEEIIFKIYIYNLTDIYTIKEQIYTNNKYPICEQQLTYNDKVLEDNYTLFYYNIKNESIINLKLINERNKIKIKFYNSNGKLCLEKYYSK